MIIYCKLIFKNHNFYDVTIINMHDTIKNISYAAPYKNYTGFVLSIWIAENIVFDYLSWIK